MTTCKLCSKRILTGSRFLNCCICKCTIHIACLPFFFASDYEHTVGNDWICILCNISIFPFNHISDDDEFLSALPYARLNLEDLQKYIFDPFDFNNDVDDAFQNEYDPDHNFFKNYDAANCIQCCDYVTVTSFNDKCADPSLKCSSVSICCLNIRSAHKNLDMFELFLETITLNFAFLGLTETWLSSSTVDLHGIANYQSENMCRASGRGGGVSLLIKNGIFYRVRTDFCVMSEELELLFIEIDKTVFHIDKCILIGVVYRPPGTPLMQFNSSLNDILTNINKENKYIYLMGDFNINLLNHESHGQTAEFLEIMYTSFLFPLITKPTRVTSTTATIIDNIFTNNIQESHYYNGIFPVDISDHYPVFCIMHSKSYNLQAEFYFTRELTNRNIENFSEKLKEANWTQVTECNDAQQSFTKYYQTYCNLYNQCFPIKRKKRGYVSRIPWLTDGLRRSIQIKNKLYVQSKKSPTTYNLTSYKNYKQHLRRLLRISERNYYDATLESNKNNLKKSWAIIKNVLNKKVKSQSAPNIMIGDEEISDKAIIAQKFNDYFTNIGSTLSNSIPSVDGDPTSFIPKVNSHSLFLYPVNEIELKNIVKSLRNSSPGHDAVLARILKTSYEAHAVPLLHVVNLSLSQGVFPSELKLARVTPIFKSGDSSQLTNYRPVSVLSSYSKILERIVYNRLINFINKHNILYKLQFGFRQKYDTSLALIYLVDKIVTALNNGDIVLGVFIDLKKAFDTVNHEILMKKLQKYGVRGIAYNWISDYITNRKQYVMFANNPSKEGVINCGVPQGSVLGPLLFILYVNDLVNVSNLIFPLMFADDTNFFVSGSNAENLVTVMNGEMKKVVKWMKINKLSLNVAKTNYMIFTPPRYKITSSCKVMINDTLISKVNNIKFLGVVIDSKLTWNDHVQHIKIKMSKAIGIICKTRKYFHLMTLRKLYFAFVNPHLQYCIEVWGNTFEYLIDSLFILQKKIIRIMKSAPYRSHCEPLFLELKILNLKQMYTVSMIMFYYKYRKSLLPEVFNNMFSCRGDIHSYMTRNTLDIDLPSYGTVHLQRTLRYDGAKIWNAYKNSVDTNCAIHTFRKRIVSHILCNI